MLMVRWYAISRRREEGIIQGPRVRQLPHHFIATTQRPVRYLACSNELPVSKMGVLDQRWVHNLLSYYHEI